MKEKKKKEKRTFLYNMKIIFIEKKYKKIILKYKL